MNNNLEKLKLEYKNTNNIQIKSKIIYYLRFDKELSYKEISQLLSLSYPYISTLLRIYRLPQLVIDGYLDKIITKTHLYILSRLKNTQEIISAYENILKHNLTAFQSDELIRSIKYNIKTSKTIFSQEDRNKLEEIILNIDQKINIKIIQTRIKTKLIFEIKEDTKYSTKVLKKILSIIKNGVLKMTE